MSTTRFGKKLSNEAKNKISKKHKGILFSEEHKEKLSKAHKGKKGYWEGKENKWGHHTKATKEMIRKANLGRHPSDGTRKKMRERRATQIFPLKDTTIEVKIQNFLKFFHVEFLTHYYISEITHAYQVDILIPSKKIIIEADGCYWHGCPICNKNLNEWQIKQAEKDEIRTKELQEKGYNVIRLKEHDIKEMKLKDFQETINNCVKEQVIKN
jgi:DNA mismatch endonuclease (patch repair protein)